MTTHALVACGCGGILEILGMGLFGTGGAIAYVWARLRYLRRDPPS